jgi:uncharacterized metal-binding protein YceD (DUF177 family)
MEESGPIPSITSFIFTVLAGSSIGKSSRKGAPMIIDVSKMKTVETFKVEGTEPWLSKIYSEFKTPKNTTAPLLRGSISVDARDPACVTVKGSIEYSPFVDCSRCGLGISWPISETIETRFLRDLPDFSDDLELDEASIEEFTLMDGKTFDLEELINDVVQLALPARLVQAGPNDECLVCDEKLSEPIHDVKDVDPLNPFRALKNIKLDS